MNLVKYHATAPTKIYAVRLPVRVSASSGAGNKRVFDDENERNGASVSEGRGLLLRSLGPDVRRRCFLYDTSTTKPLVMGTP